MFKHILLLFLLSQISLKKLKKTSETFTFTPTEVNFESLCHNLEKGFSFSIVISENPNYSATFSNVFNLISTKDNTEIKTLCTLYSGDTEIICSTVENKPTNSKGPFKVKSVSAFEFNCNIGETSKETKCKFSNFNFTDTVGYSELFSTYNLQTPDQTIDYTKSADYYSFHLNFDYIDEQSNTKVFYYDEEDEQNYEITTCDFAFYSDLVLECPVTKATLPCSDTECKYQIYIEDDCGYEYDAIVVTVVGKKSSSSATSSTSSYNNYNAGVNWIGVGKVLMGMILVVLV